MQASAGKQSGLQSALAGTQNAAMNALPGQNTSPIVQQLLLDALSPKGIDKFDPQGLGQTLLGASLKAMGEKMILDDKYAKQAAFAKPRSIDFSSGSRRAGGIFNSSAMF